MSIGKWLTFQKARDLSEGRLDRHASDARITTYQWTRSRFEIEIAGDRCSSEEFGQEHAHLLVVRAQGAVAGDTQRYGYWTLRLKKAIANKHRCPILCPKAVICTVMYGHNGNSGHIFLKYC